MIMLAAEVMRAAGLEDGQYAIRVNNRKLLDGILEASGVPNTQEGAEQRLQVLRAIDKLDRLGADGVEALLGEGREDESGDYTQGAKLGVDGIKAVLGFTTASANSRADTIRTLETLVGQSERGCSGVDELVQIDTILNAVGFGNDRVAYDTSIVRGLGYYTGPVFEAELLTDIRDVPATGFSFGVSRFLTALERMDKLEAEVKPPVVICAFDRSLMGEYFKLAGELHAAGIRAEVFVGSGNVTKQMKYADRRKAQVAVLMGSDEMEAGQITLKDLYEGAKAAEAIKSNEEWKSSRPAQETVARGNWVKAVQAMLAG